MTDIVKYGQNRHISVKKVTKSQQLLPKSDLARAFPDLPEYLTADEAHRILAVIDKPRNELLFRLLWQTGLRITEALQFSMERMKDGIYYPVRKGGRVKPVHIPVDLMNDLMHYAIEERIPYESLIFPISRIQAWRLLQRYAKLAGTRKLHPHLFRHGFAVNVLKQNPNLPVIQDALGHEHIETTRQYLRVIMPDVKEVIQRISF
ncbi:MAG: tyrosine-type recombinase/integrase [Dehalococcoidia bacterium]|nr:tyrosine-type recombinase/integrase [Dehalococcoidia bacterium]